LTKPPAHLEEPTREWLLGRLRQIMEIALNRVANPKTPSGDRIKWSRIVIYAGGACNSVLRDVEIETLKQQVEELKRLTSTKLSDEDEQGNDQEGDTETSADN